MVLRKRTWLQCKYGRYYCLASRWLLVNNLKTKAVRTFVKSCGLGVLAFHDLVAARKCLTILRGKFVLGRHLWVYAGNFWIKVCPYRTHNTVYQGWPIVMPVSPSFRERYKGALLGPGAKAFLALSWTLQALKSGTTEAKGKVLAAEPGPE